MDTWCLVKLEIRDFKSFHGEHLIGPFDSFTGIIGPNGSGKSNVLDAIAFVFFLDFSPRSTNYIFRTGIIEPAQSCSVKATIKMGETEKTFEREFGNPNRLILDDSEKAEAEYIQAVRDCGITPLSFIRQGEVDAIARKSPNELTQFLEEMSGSVQYAADYERLKIDSESAHEAITLIEKRRKAAMTEKRHISDRKEEAAKFRSMTDEEAKLQLKAALFKLYHANRIVNLTKDERAALQAAKNDLSSEYEHQQIILKMKQKESNDTSSVKSKKESEISETEQKQRNIVADLIKGQETLEVLTERLETAQKEMTMNTSEAKEREHQIKEMEEERQSVENELASLPMIPEIEEQISQYNSIRAQASRQYSDVANELRDKVAERTEVINEKENNTKQLESDKTSLKRIEQMIETNETDIKSTAAKLQQVQKSIDSLRGSAKMKEQSDVFDQQKQKELAENVRDLNRQYEEARRETNTSKRAAALNKAISSMQQMIQGVYGKFSALCPIAETSGPKKKYVTAVTIGVGAWADSIIVKDKEVAAKCIEFLRQQGAGTATFLPLRDLVVPQREKVTGGQPLIQFLRCDPLYRTALEFVCGQTVICTDQNEAKKVAFGSRVPAVALDGTYVDPRGIITGGPSTKASGYGSKNIDEIENSRRAAEDCLAKIGDIIETRRLERIEIEEKIMGLEPQHKVLANNLHEFNEKSKRLQGDKRIMEKEIKEMEEKIKDCEKKVKEAQDNVDNVDLQVAEIDSKLFADFINKVGVKSIKEFEVNRLQGFKERYTRRLKLQSRKTTLDTLLEADKRREDNEDIGQISERVEELKKQKQETIESIKQLESAQADIESSLKAMNEVKESLDKEYEAKQSELKSLRKELHYINDEISKNAEESADAERKYSSASQILSSVFEQCRLSNIQLPHTAPFEVQMTSTPSSMTQENLDINEADLIDFKSVEVSEKAMVEKDDFEKQVKDFEEKLSKVRAELSQIRPDLKSDDRFTDVEKELEQMQVEQEELKVKARETSRQFNEVKEKRRETFMLLLNYLDNRVDEIYKILTRMRHVERAGTAYLSLEDTEEPYLGGVKYNAMPPHKRFRDLEQLSGGEKAVASIALIMSLQEYLKTPFILMDEPDASLDKINLKAAAVALREMAEKSQFICVSLRDRFFEYANSLVGVYKDQEEASSGVLTLKLSQFKDQTLVMEDA